MFPQTLISNRFVINWPNKTIKKDIFASMDTAKAHIAMHRFFDLSVVFSYGSFVVVGTWTSIQTVCRF